MAILYFETNFLIGVAKGQDSQAETLLNEFPPGTKLLIPSVCFMESLSVLNFEQRRFNETSALFDRLIDDASRDTTSAFAAPLAQHLQASKTAGGNRLNEIQIRLYDVLRRLDQIADRIDMTDEALGAALDAPLLTDPTDALILAIILEHAGHHAKGPKAFLSGNSRDFGQADAKAALEAAGVRYFPTSEAAVGWLRSQPRS